MTDFKIQGLRASGPLSSGVLRAAAVCLLFLGASQVHADVFGGTTQLDAKMVERLDKLEANLKAIEEKTATQKTLKGKPGAKPVEPEDLGEGLDLEYELLADVNGSKLVRKDGKLFTYTAAEYKKFRQGAIKAARARNDPTLLQAAGNLISPVGALTPPPPPPASSVPSFKDMGKAQNNIKAVDKKSTAPAKPTPATKK